MEARGYWNALPVVVVCSEIAGDLMTKRLRENEVSDPVRTFLDQAFESGGVIIEDEQGAVRGSVVPYFEAPPAERQAALRRLQKLQERTRAAMDEQGVAEDDIDRLLQEDD